MIPSLKKTRNTRIIPHKTGVKRFPEALLKEISQKTLISNIFSNIEPILVVTLFTLLDETTFSSKDYYVF